MDNRKTADLLFGYLRNVLYNPDQAELDVSALPEEFQDLGCGLEFLASCLKEYNSFADALSRGNLDYQPPGVDNVIAAPIKRIQGDLRHLTWVTKQVAQGDYGQRVDYLGEFSDAFNTMVQQLKLQKKQLEQIAFTDELTGLYNRKYAVGLTNGYWDKGVKFCVGFVDVDGLKFCNDHFGHTEGDNYILLVCRFLLDMAGNQDCVCRMGGDEFLYITRNHGLEELENRLKDTRNRLIQATKETKPYPCDFSFGCAFMDPGGSVSYSDLLHEADLKMYTYKMGHRNRRGVTYPKEG